MRISQRIRTLARIIPVAGIALLLAACGVDGGREIRDSVDRETLRIKLDALMADSCHSEPESREPWQCEKYVTQLANTANTVSAAANTGFPQLAGPGRRMTAAVEKYRSHGCARQSPSAEDTCVAALTELADAVTAAERAIGS